MVYVIGGNIREVQDLIRRGHIKDCVVIDELLASRDLKAPEVIVTGTFPRGGTCTRFMSASETGATWRFIP